MTIVVRPNGAACPRLGLAVARRVMSRAVDRHRLKRIVRESFRHDIERLRGLDVVVIANPGVEKMSSKAVRGLLARLWERAGRRMHREARQRKEAR